MTTNPDMPKRGEIWLVNFDPRIGAEIKAVAALGVEAFLNGWGNQNDV